MPDNRFQFSQISDTKHALRIMRDAKPHARRELFGSKKLNGIKIEKWPNWQLRVLNRLDDMQVIKRLSGGTYTEYQAVDLVALNNILNDPESLSRVLWKQSTHLALGNFDLLEEPEEVPPDIAPEPAPPEAQIMSATHPEIPQALLPPVPPELQAEQDDIQKLVTAWNSRIGTDKRIGTQDIVTICNELGLFPEYLDGITDKTAQARGLANGALKQYRGINLGGFKIDYSRNQSTNKRWGLKETKSKTPDRAYRPTISKVQAPELPPAKPLSLIPSKEPEKTALVALPASNILNKLDSSITELLQYQHGTFSLLEKLVDSIVNIRTSVETVYNRVKKLDPSAAPTKKFRDDCCSFCSKTTAQVSKLLPGPGVYICDECVKLCSELLSLK